MGSESRIRKDASTTSRIASQPISVPTHLFAAGIAAAASAVAVQPLDVLKTRLQTNVALRQNMFANIRHIARTEGMRGLYRGLVPTLCSVVPSISIYFTLYNSIKGSMGCPSGDPFRDVATQSFAAGLASCSTAAITNPLWLVKTRLQTQPIYKTQVATKSTLQTLRSIVKKEGFRGLYKGLGASFLASSQAMVQFPIYEELKLLMCSPNSSAKRNTVNYLGASAISASLACVLTYPAEVIRARLQAQGHTKVYNGVFHAFKKVLLAEGVFGLYRGLLTSIVKMTPAHAISFTTYEYILRFLTTNPDLNSSESDVQDMTKNENIQFAFRPYSPEWQFFRSPSPDRYKFQANPYSFAPSFTHLIHPSYFAEPIAASSALAPNPIQTNRWSEYFW